MRGAPFLAAGVLATVTLSLGCASAPPAPLVHADPRLRDVKTVFLGDFSDQEGSALVREKIRKALVEWGRFRPVESVQDADATVMGVAGVETKILSVGDGGGQVSRGVGLLRIVNERTNETLWTFEYRRSTSGDLSASSRVAIQFIDDLKSALAGIEGGR